FTVFAPTNAAWEVLQPNLLNALLTDPEGVLSDILLYHVVPGQFAFEDLVAGQGLVTALGQDLEVTETGGNFFVGGSQITMNNILADNGIVHVISVALAPETTRIFDVVENSLDHTILEAALIATGLDVTLAGPPSFPYFANNFTLFAPTDAAFEALPSGLIDALLANPEGTLTDVLENHVVSGNVLSTDLTDGQNVSTLGPDSWMVSIDGETITIGNAVVTVANIPTLNGVVHVVDAVLGSFDELPTVYDIIEESAEHTTLETALIEAELNTTLDGEGTFTVFAPTNEAFEALPEGLLNELLADPSGDLTDILLYHVVGSVAYSSSLSNDQMIPTLFTEAVTITITEEEIFVNNALVTTADIAASNGVVHVINAVLIPATLSATEAQPFGKLSLFPNPSIDELSVAGDFSGNVNYSVFDLQGKVVLQGNINEGNLVRISVSSIPAGVYTLQLTDGKNTSLNKFAIQR
ncbi:MAG: fasciclin domain-containing protein, partial [Cryomorphaceae bacterium]